MASLATHEIGEGFPVLFIHGWECSGKVEELDFEPIFKQVSGFQRIYIDLPGHGSSPANGVKDLDDMYSRLVHFIDTKLQQSRFLLVGSSCGGYLAHALAQHYADQIDGVLLRVPLVEPQTDLRDLDSFQPLVKGDEAMTSLSREDRALLGNVPVQTPEYIQSLKTKFMSTYVPALEAADKEALAPIRADPQLYRLSSLSGSSKGNQRKVLAPALILCGREDQVTGYRDSLSLLELYSRSTFVVLDRAGHDLPVDDHGVFEVLVQDWLRRVGEWRRSAVR